MRGSMQASIPGWVDPVGSVERKHITSYALAAAIIRDTAADVPDAVFRRLGADLHGIAPRVAAYAYSTITVTAPDDTGYPIPAGTQMEIAGLSGERVAFVTTVDAAIDATETSVAGVQIRSVIAGTEANDLDAVPELVNALTFDATIVLDDPTSGGVDDETDAEYLDRLADQLTLQSPRPITESDCAAYAVFVEPEVYRAAAVNGFDPADDSTGNERMITIFPIAEDGGVVSVGAKTRLLAEFADVTEINMEVYIDDPTMNTIDVVAEVAVWDGYTAASVATSVDAAIDAWLSATTWGRPPYGEVPTWIVETKVRYLSLAEIVRSVAGVRYIESLEVSRRVGAVTCTAATNLVTSASAHGLAVDDPVRFDTINTPNNITAGVTYYVKTAPSATTFTIAATVGGSTYDITADSTAAAYTAGETVDITMVGAAPLPVAGTTTVTTV